MKRIKSFIGLLAAALFLVTFSGPGAAQTTGSILVDRFHGQVPVTISAFTTWLESQEWVVNEVNEPITINILSGYDVLLVLRPSEAFQDSEVEAITSYVESGGGLWMLEDVGNSEPLSNTLAAEFGVTFNADQVLDYYSADYEHPTIDFFQPHPVTTGVGSFLYNRGCSLVANFPAVVIARASMYSETTSGLAGDIPVLAAAEYGNGRAVFIGDMTPLANYVGLSDDHKLLLANTVAWLSEPEVQVISTEPKPVKVTIEVRPWTNTNRITLKSRGVTPVALMTDDNFVATKADPATVRFAGAPPVRWIAIDVDRDRDKDFLFFFKTSALNLTEESVQATMTGTFEDGTSFEGSDEVNCVPKKWKKFKWNCPRKRR